VARVGADVTPGRAGGLTLVVARIEATDAELLGSVEADPGRFAVFYDRYETAVLGYFVRRTRDAELAADLTAEVFASALGAAARYRPQAPTAAPWLFTIAHHVLSRSLRQGRVEARARQRLGIVEAFELEGAQIDRVMTVLAGDEWVDQVLRDLPVDQEAAIRARIVEELPYEEIANRLQTSELVIRKRVSRGLASLRERLEDPS